MFNKHSKRILSLIISIIIVLFTTSAVWSEASEAFNDDLEDYTEMSLEELVEVEITSASRQKQLLSDTALPVSVVSADDIHYSGLMNLYEILQFTPSIDSLQMNRNHYALGVHGLHETFSDRTLTLINGCPADNPAYGGSEFLRLPLFLEDIKQIEVLRGPSSSAWGANAFNGAINIITKKPEECKGVLFSTAFDHLGDSYHHMRWADSKEDWSWRVSAGYENQLSSSDALDGRMYESVFGDFTSRDYRRKSAIDTEFFKKGSDGELISFGLAYSYANIGDFGYITYFPREEGFWKTTRAYSRVERQYDEDTKSELLWFGAMASTKMPSLMRYDTLENQLQTKLDFILIEDHKSSVGADLKIDYINQKTISDQELVFGADPENTQAAGVFLVDLWHITERLNIETQFRTGWYSETSLDWAGRLSGIYALDKEKDNILRLSSAKSYRTPLASLREAGTTRMGGALYLIPGGDLDNEETYSFEAGYTRKMGNMATFRLDSFLQKYDDLIGYQRLSQLPQVFQPKNLGSAEMYGAETEIALHQEHYHISLWYNYSHFATKEEAGGFSETQEVRAYLPAKHKIGTTLRWFLQKDLVANINYKHSSFSDGNHGPETGSVPGFNRLDLSLTWKFAIDKTKGEFLIGVSDILNETEEIVGDTGIILYPYETPGRTCFARLQLNF